MNWVNYLNNCITIINSAINFHAAIEQKYRFRDLKMHLCCIICCVFLLASQCIGENPGAQSTCCFIFHINRLPSSPSLLFIHPSTIPLLQPRHLSFPPLCLARYQTSRYQGVIPSPSKVKWYKVIGGSGLLTGWPPQGLLPAANRTLTSPTAACLHPWWALGGTSRDPYGLKHHDGND